MKNKRVLALVLTVVMLLSILAGCGTEKPVETTPKETQGANKPVETQPAETESQTTITFPLEETYELSVLYTLGNASYPVADNVAWKHLQEISNLKFNTTEIAPNEAKEKLNLLMSSGEYGDILFKGSKIDLDQYGMDGLLIPLEDLIREYCPNLTAILDERDAWNEIAAPDGHIYALPQFNATSPNAGGSTSWWINQTWLDKLGLKMPTSLDELYNVLKAFKEQDPNGNGLADEVPMVMYNDQALLNTLMSLSGNGLAYPNFWKVIDGQMEYLPTTEHYKQDYLTFMNKLYTEGLVNQDLFTIDRDQFRASCASEEVIYGFLCDSSCIYFANEDEQLGWVLLRPFDTDNYALGKGIGKGGLSITDKCERPDIVMAWADYLYSQEGGAVVRMGVPDVSYFVAEDGTWEYNDAGMESAIYQGTLMGTGNVPALIPDIYYEMPGSVHTRHLNLELYGDDGINSEGVLMPAITLTAEENEEFSVLQTDLKSYVQNYAAECISGIISIEETWDDFQNTLKEMGVDRMEEIYQAAYNRAIG